jgi:ParB family transcriptional regulator, chromosome partitioning protein
MSPPAASEQAMWPINRLHRNPFNPRGALHENGLVELADSIREQGILQSLLITPKGMVVAGHRRLEAAKLAGLTEVPVTVRDLSAKQQQEIMLVENLQRHDLTPLEEGRAFQRLLDAGYTSSELARRLGFNTQRVHTRVLLLKLDPDVQEFFHTGDLPIGLSAALARVKDPAKQRRIATLAVRRRLTSPQLQALIEASESVRAPAPTPTPIRVLPPEDADHDEPGKLSSTRQDSLDFLRGSPTRTLTFEQLGNVFEKVCCSCGMGDTPDICAACPLAEMMGELRQLGAVAIRQAAS